MKVRDHGSDGELLGEVSLGEPAQAAGEADQASTSTRSPFPPIADYAFLSDCEVNALIAPSGRVEWLCTPRPDGPSVFGAILDRASGSFRFGPTGVMVPAGRRYLPGTLVLETTWRTHTGWMVIRDALCIGPWYHERRRSGTHRRPPTDHEAEHMLLRTARCIVEPCGRTGATGTTRPPPAGAPTTCR